MNLTRQDYATPQGVHPTERAIVDGLAEVMGGERPSQNRASGRPGFSAGRLYQDTRRKGVALFRYGDRIGAADVIFGEEGDSTLLGATTLESLRLVLDSLRRELRPVPMVL